MASPVVQVRVPEGLLERIDAVRGEVSRSSWLVTAAEAVLGGAVVQGNAGLVLPVVQGASGSDGRVDPGARVGGGGGSRVQCVHRNWGRFCRGCGCLIDAKGWPA